ncbi:hypothetical protein HZF24_01525 [Sedimentibacter hydroxybenzoicus DSM 7310]|uniref:Uncharacterized protein n=1 Tax=Sedimentibacter hydroxybenzoicus DSM 7310 TaxID=1123245 RepID=A0A974BHJ8_SEDHY|nr:hypothetical protein [Sedimentibacter hydroxybenzoicus]NYB72815.1 hypothetical protein [Sedimentibacter hydroxybenzoicus DSM 7310]
MEMETRDLSSIEIRSLMLDTLAYDGDDIDAEGKTFKSYGYQGTQSDLYRLMEGLAIKRGLLKLDIPLRGSAWSGDGIILYPQSTTNFSFSDIQNIYEQFHLLLNQGIIAPGAVGNYGQNLPDFHVTKYGLRCLEEHEILPYDVDGYLRRINSIPSISKWVEFYIKEALQCYNANCMEAAVIMLGLSSEKILDEQIDALLRYLYRNYTDEFSLMQTEVSNIRFASAKFNCYKKYFDMIKNNISDQTFKDMLPLVDRVSFQAYANFTRITRNGLAHPSDTKMERIEVLMIFISFIKYCQTQYGFINYYINN